MICRTNKEAEVNSFNSIFDTISITVYHFFRKAIHIPNAVFLVLYGRQVCNRQTKVTILRDKDISR